MGIVDQIPEVVDPFPKVGVITRRAALNLTRSEDHMIEGAQLIAGGRDHQETSYHLETIAFEPM